jgi:hypothetical protein
MSATNLKPCPFCGASPAPAGQSRQVECGQCGTAGPWGRAADDRWNARPIEAALRARAEAAEAAAAAAGPITVCDCGVGGPRLCDEDGLCVNCGCDVVVVADQHSADIVAQLRQEREAAEAALATARTEGAAAERARILDVIRERAASRWAQAVACAEAGGNADVVDAKAGECESLALILDGTATMPRWPGRPVEST